MRTLTAIFSLVAISTMAIPSFAKSNAPVSSSTTVIQPPKKDNRIWSGFLNAEYSRPAVDHQDGSFTTATDLFSRLNLIINKDFTSRFELGYSIDNKDSENNDFSNASVTLSRSPFKIHDRLNMSYTLSAALPTSKNSYKNDSLQTSLSASLAFIVNSKYLIKGLDLVARLRLARNIHKYEEAYSGKVNSQYSSRQTLGVSYTLPIKVYISANFSNSQSWSYQGNKTDSFSIDQEVGYEISSSVSMAIGHRNGGSLLRENGYESNIQFYDKENSNIYASATVSF